LIDLLKEDSEDDQLLEKDDEDESASAE